MSLEENLQIMMQIMTDLMKTQIDLLNANITNHFSMSVANKIICNDQHGIFVGQMNVYLNKWLSAQRNNVRNNIFYTFVLTKYVVEYYAHLISITLKLLTTKRAMTKVKSYRCCITNMITTPQIIEAKFSICLTLLNVVNSTY